MLAWFGFGGFGCFVGLFCFVIGFIGGIGFIVWFISFCFVG